MAVFHAAVPAPPVINGFATLPDILRLIAVPLLAWAAWRDYQTRRVPGFDLLSTPLVILGFFLLLWEGIVALRGSTLTAQIFLFRAGFSLGIFVPLAYLLRWRDLFGGVDTRTFVLLAVLFPTYPVFHLFGLSFPIISPPLWIFSLTVLMNGSLVGLIYPVALALRNVFSQNISPKMFLGVQVPWYKIPEKHGRILESSNGIDLHGLDLDALRMYLRWRRASLTDLRTRPAELRDPATVPDEPGDPTDGRLDPAERLASDVSDEQPAPDADPFEFADDWEYADPWAAEEFIETVGRAYGTTPGGLREGLELLSRADRVWVSPGLPYLVPVFVGLVVGLTYGDLLYAGLQALGLG